MPRDVCAPAIRCKRRCKKFKLRTPSQATRLRGSQYELQYRLQRARPCLRGALRKAGPVPGPQKRLYFSFPWKSQLMCCHITTQNKESRCSLQAQQLTQFVKQSAPQNRCTTSSDSMCMGKCPYIHEPCFCRAVQFCAAGRNAVHPCHRQRLPMEDTIACPGSHHFCHGFHCGQRASEFTISYGCQCVNPKIE